MVSLVILLIYLMFFSRNFLQSSSSSGATVLRLQAIIGILHHQAAVCVRVQIVVQYALEIIRVEHFSTVPALASHIFQNNASLDGSSASATRSPSRAKVKAGMENSRLIYQFIFKFLGDLYFSDRIARKCQFRPFGNKMKRILLKRCEELNSGGHLSVEIKLGIAQIKYFRSPLIA